MPAARSVLTLAAISLERPARNSTGMPKRAMNLGISSLRMTGSGEPATTTDPSFFAAANHSFHCFSHLFSCAHRGAAKKKISNRIPPSILDLLVEPLPLTALCERLLDDL